MAAQMKAFFDSTAQLWKEQKLAGKPARFFVSTGTQGGGQETTASHSEGFGLQWIRIETSPSRFMNRVAPFSSNTGPRDRNPCPIAAAISAYLAAKRSVSGYSSPSSATSPSSSSSESDVPPPPSPVLPQNQPLEWERKITSHISYNSGVFHIPKHVGRRIPRGTKKLPLYVAGGNRVYVCSLRSAVRCRDEKYLFGKTWRTFVGFENLRVGDTLKIRIRGAPLRAVVEINRV